MRYCGILALPRAVVRYSYPPYAPLLSFWSWASAMMSWRQQTKSIVLAVFAAILTIKKWSLQEHLTAEVFCRSILQLHRWVCLACAICLSEVCFILALYCQNLAYFPFIQFGIHLDLHLGESTFSLVLSHPMDQSFSSILQTQVELGCKLPCLYFFF